MMGNVDKKERFVENMNQYLMKEHTYKYRLVKINATRTTVSACRKKFDIYLRFPSEKKGQGAWNTETLIIARIYFAKTRSGHGTSFLKFLVEQSSYGYGYIGLEMTNDNSMAFAKKFKFKENNGKDWIVNIEDLRNFLKNSEL